MRKTLFKMLLVMALVLITPIQANAKTLDATLTEDYSNCLMKLSFKNEGLYQATVTSPDGKIYNFTQISETTMECILEKAIKGTWLINIENAVSENKEPVEEEMETQEAPDENSDEEMSAGDIDTIGEVTVSISIQKEQSPDDANAIKIGRDIAGLEVYFKDDSIVAEWTDETCGNISIKVVNLDNAETLANESIGNEKYFELPLKENVDRISIQIVPNNSLNVDGAETNLVFEVDNHPHATVTFPEQEYSNQATLPVDVTMDSSYGVYVENNDAPVLEEGLIQKGVYTYNVPLIKEGENIIKFYIVDEEGNMRSTSKTIIKDTVAPVLELSQEYDGIETHDLSYLISGKVKDYSLFTINGESITPATDGYFEYNCSLHLGTNLITLQASDLAGNLTEYNINFAVTEEEKSILPLVICGLLIIVGLIMIFSSKIKKRISKNNKNFGRGINEFENAPSSDEVRDLFDEAEQNYENSNTDDDGISVKTHKNDSKTKFHTNAFKRKKEKEPKNFKKRKKGSLGEWISCILIAVAVYVAFGIVLQISPIMSNSMSPVMETNDLGLFYRMAYKNNLPERGDVIQFYNSELGMEVCKRVVALEGETVTFHDGYVFINGKYYDETYYLDEELETNCMKTFTVPAGCCFTLGDNRENSFDARYWDNPYTPYQDIKAKFLIALPTHTLTE